MGTFFSGTKFRLWMFLTLLANAYTVLALAIPEATSTGVEVSTPHYTLHELARAEPDYLTMYGLYDETTESDGQPGLPPVGDVFLAMITSSAVTTAPTDAGPTSPARSQPTSPTAQSTATSDPAASSFTATLESPPVGGPGLVKPSSVPPGFTTATSGPQDNLGTTSSAETPETPQKVTPSHRLIVLGSLIGSILFCTVCLYFLLDPAVTRRLAACCGGRKRFGKKGKEDKGISHDSPASWGPEYTLADVSGSPSLEKGAQGANLIETPSNAVAISKFSICSSDHLSASSKSSQRDSYVASEYSQDTMKQIRPGSPPPRPPRPPTADSPALSDSVYLACSDQPYVIVVPQPLDNADINSATAKNAQRKILTSSEFLALHPPVTGAPTSIQTPATPATRKRSVSFKNAPKRDSYHSRTKSAPLLGLSMLAARFSTSRSSSSSATVDRSDSETSSSEIVKRITKHRRSRSASGWAYPEQPRSKRFPSVKESPILK